MAFYYPDNFWHNVLFGNHRNKRPKAKETIQIDDNNSFYYSSDSW